MECIFCRIIKDQEDRSLIMENDHVICIMDKHPLTKGHCLVIPKTHYRDLSELDENTACEVIKAVRKIDAAVRISYDGVIGTNILQFNGAPMQDVFHYHTHIIPRYAHDGRIILDLKRPRVPKKKRDNQAARIAAKLIMTIFLMAFMFLSGCSNKESKPLPYDNIIEKNGVFYYKGTTKPAMGKFVKKEWGYVHIIQLVNGQKHGIQRYYDKDGLLQSEYGFRYGEKHGIEAKYFNNGNKMYEYYYDNGKYDSVWRHYYENGVVQDERVFENSKLIGKRKRFNEKGELIEEVEW